MAICVYKPMKEKKPGGLRRWHFKFRVEGIWKYRVGTTSKATTQRMAMKAECAAINAALAAAVPFDKVLGPACRKGRLTERQLEFIETCAARRKLVEARDAGRCALCGRVGGQWEADHYVPRHLGGIDELSNLQTLCDKCHRAKCNRESLAAWVMCGKDAPVDKAIRWFGPKLKSVLVVYHGLCPAVDGERIEIKAHKRTIVLTSDIRKVLDEVLWI